MFNKHTFLVAILTCLVVGPVNAATIIGPTPYLSIADTPDAFFPVGALVCLQDFESPDGPWETGFHFNDGKRIGPKFVSGDGVPVTDSVDADDNAIDGDGTMGSSWFTWNSDLRLTFDEGTARAGFVFTDTDRRTTVITIEAFGINGASLIQQAYDATMFIDDVFTGTTSEDRFFGIAAMGGELIKEILITIDKGEGIEIDHVQFEKVPEPASITLVLLSMVGLGRLRRRRR